MIPIINPTIEQRNAIVLVGLQQITNELSGSAPIAQRLFDSMSDIVINQNYYALRNMAIGQYLTTTTGSLSTKFDVTNYNENNGSISLNGSVNVSGSSAVTGYASDGRVTVTVVRTATVSADSIRGLLPTG